MHYAFWDFLDLPLGILEVTLWRRGADASIRRIFGWVVAVGIWKCVGLARPVGVLEASCKRDFFQATRTTKPEIPTSELPKYKTLNSKL